nr:reverse transcriptase domain-containing protein [Tanacetum cinerariifolium]
MTDNRTMAEMLCAPTEGCAEAIIVPPILAEQFELKHSLINMMTSEQFFGLKKDNPHDHVRCPQDALTIDENKSKVRNSQSKLIASPVNACDNHSSSELAKLTHAVNQQTSDVTTAMTARLKQLQSNPPPAQVKAVEEICVTYGAIGNYNQGNPSYRPQGVANQMRLRGFAQPNVQNNQNRFGSRTLPGNTIANLKGELKAITTRSGLVTDGPTIPNPPKFVNPEEDECVEETYTDPDHAEYTIKVPPPPPVQTPKPPIQRNFVLHTRDSLPPHIPDPKVPLILGRPFLRTARALIDVHGEEMILRDGDERLTLNMKHDTASYSNHPRRESVNLINIFNLSTEDCLEDLVSNKQKIASPEVIHEFHDSKGCTFLSEELPDIDSFNDIHPHFDDDPLSGSTTYSANSLLEEFADELALMTYPLDYDDNRTCDIESDIREIEFLLSQ